MNRKDRVNAIYGMYKKAYTWEKYIRDTKKIESTDGEVGDSGITGTMVMKKFKEWAKLFGISNDASANTFVEYYYKIVNSVSGLDPNDDILKYTRGRYHIGVRNFYNYLQSEIDDGYSEFDKNPEEDSDLGAAYEYAKNYGKEKTTYTEGEKAIRVITDRNIFDSSKAKDVSEYEDADLSIEEDYSDEEFDERDVKFRFSKSNEKKEVYKMPPSDEAPTESYGSHYVVLVNGDEYYAIKESYYYELKRKASECQKEKCYGVYQDMLGKEPVVLALVDLDGKEYFLPKNEVGLPSWFGSPSESATTMVAELVQEEAVYEEFQGSKPAKNTSGYGIIYNATVYVESSDIGTDVSEEVDVFRYKDSYWYLPDIDKLSTALDARCILAKNKEECKSQAVNFVFSDPNKVVSKFKAYGMDVHKLYSISNNKFSLEKPDDGITSYQEKTQVDSTSGDGAKSKEERMKPERIKSLGISQKLANTFEEIISDRKSPSGSKWHGGGSNNWRYKQPSLKETAYIIIDLGVKNVIRMNGEEGTGVSPCTEKQLVEYLGANYVTNDEGKGSCLFQSHLGTPGNARKPIGLGYVTAQKEIREYLDGGNTFIHCTSGVDRTGMAWGSYRVFSQGWEPKRAWEEFSSINRKFKGEGGWMCAAVRRGNHGYPAYVHTFYPVEDWCREVAEPNGWNCSTCKRYAKK